MGDADNADYKESNIEIFDTVDEVKVTAIVLAAGKGSRMHSDIPKQFMTLGLSRTVLFAQGLSGQSG